MSGRKTIRHIVAAAVCACMAFLCCETHAQSTGTPNSADTPDKNEKSWTPERMKRAQPLMPNPKTDTTRKLAKPRAVAGRRTCRRAGIAAVRSERARGEKQR